MAIITTKGIVLKRIKYSDDSIIVRSFTQKEGIKNYLVKGVLRIKKGKFKPAYFQPLTQLLITGNHNNKNNLNYIKELQTINQYKTIHTSIIKQSIIIFLSDVLYNTIQEEEKNNELYNYIETSLIWFDVNKNITNFHLLFLLNLTKFIGLYPDITKQNCSFFDLLEGKFTNSLNIKLGISGDELTNFKKLLNIDFNTINKLSFNKTQRQSLLQIIIKYFELHLEGFKKPKSLEILESVFS